MSKESLMNVVELRAMWSVFLLPSSKNDLRKLFVSYNMLWNFFEKLELSVDVMAMYDKVLLEPVDK